VGVGLVAGCVLALQVLLTRLFSAVLYYHFSFLSISLALLGAGAGAIAVYLRSGWFDRQPLEQRLAAWSLVLAALLLVVPAGLARVQFGTGDEITARLAAKLGLASLLCVFVFAAAGIVIALAIRGYTAVVSRLYAFDLGGAALGALAVVPLMWAVGVPSLVVGLAPVAALAALLFLGPAGGRRRAAAGGFLALGVAAVALAGSTDLYEPEPATGVAEGVTPVTDRWTPLSRVVGYGPETGGGQFALLFYDRVYAPVPVWRRGEPMPDWSTLHLGPQSLGYVMGGRERALVIGGGGGRDIFNALTSGVRRLDVIELNRGIRDAVDGALRRFSGGPYSLPRVHTRIGDGRSELGQREVRYDVIHIGFTDTLSANSAQAFALTENNLYTLEAFDEYFDHLRPDGVLDVSRPHRLVGDEALRATVLTLEALRRRGIERPERNVVVAFGRDLFGGLFGTILARPRPWRAAELRRVRALALERGQGVVFAPGGPYRREWRELARSSSPEAFCSSYRLDVCAPTDDKPFFFNMRRLGSLGSSNPGYIYAVDPFAVLLVTLGILAVLSLALVLAPLLAGARGDRPPLAALGFFAAIGFGFLTLEVALIQRFVLFLGFPTYALSVVLFALLLWTGAGSLLAGRVGDPRRALSAALAVSCVMIAACALALAPLLEALLDLPFALRVAVTVALLAPVGIPLGMAMPLGLGRLAALHPGGVAWAWGVNGIASVVAAAAAIAIAIVAGFPAATLVALACYLGALVHARRSPWPRAVPAPLPAPLAEPEPVER
jgi:hypothetical protein